MRDALYCLLGASLYLAGYFLVKGVKRLAKRIARRKTILRIKATTGDLEDLLGNVYYIQAMVNKAEKLETLNHASNLTEQLFPAFRHLGRVTRYWANKLHTRILIKRAILLTSHYAITEE